jgi:hypothetical protein
MKIIVKKTGGYAGLSEDVANIDTSDETKLSSAEAKNIEQMVKNMGYFDLPPVIQSETIGADLFHYEITVINGERQHTVIFDDSDSPATLTLHQLLKTLNIQ